MRVQRKPHGTFGLALGLWSFASVWSWGIGAFAAPANLKVEILPRFNGAPLVFDAVTNRTAGDQIISVTRLDFLVSNFSLRRENGAWLGVTNWQAYLSLREGRTSFHLPNLPAGGYTAVRFLVGLVPEVNRADPAQYAPGHPLNPDVNGLHWGWAGGYVFLALEGGWQDGGNQRGYSFHIANDPQLMTVELPLTLELNSGERVQVDQPGILLWSSGNCIFRSPGGTVGFFDHDSVLQFIDANAAR